MAMGITFPGSPSLSSASQRQFPVATPDLIERMKQQMQEPVFSNVWASRFPGQIPQPHPTILANPLSQIVASRFFKAAGLPRLFIVAILTPATRQFCGCPTSSLRFVVDMVYGQVHQMLFEANTKAKLEKWIRVVEKAESLQPAYVVPGYKQVEEIDGIWHLAATKKYVQDFDNIVASEPEGFCQKTELYIPNDLIRLL